MYSECEGDMDAVTATTRVPERRRHHAKPKSSRSHVPHGRPTVGLRVGDVGPRDSTTPNDTEENHLLGPTSTAGTSSPTSPSTGSCCSPREEEAGRVIDISATSREADDTFEIDEDGEPYCKPSLEVDVDADAGGGGGVEEDQGGGGGWEMKQAQDRREEHQRQQRSQPTKQRQGPAGRHSRRHFYSHRHHYHPKRGRGSRSHSRNGSHEDDQNSPAGGNCTMFGGSAAFEFDQPVQKHVYAMPCPNLLVPPLDELIVRPASRCEKLSVEVVSLFSELMPTSHGLSMRNATLGRLHGVLNQVWRGACLRPFGSTVTGFAIGGSDVDVDIVWPDPRVESPFAPNPAVLLETLSGAMRAAGFDNVRVFTCATVPLIKARDTMTGVNIDVVHTNRHADASCDLLRAYAAADGRVTPLMLAVKRWASARGISGGQNGMLTSYTLTLMMLSFLQMAEPDSVPNLLDPSQGRRSRSSKLGFTSAGNTPAHSPRASLGNASLGQLLIAFFGTYAEYFDPLTMAVSTRLGGFVSRREPAVQYMFSRTSNPALCVEEPFAMSNVAYSVRPENSQAIFDEFRRAHKLLLAGKSMRSAVLQSADIVV